MHDVLWESERGFLHKNSAEKPTFHNCFLFKISCIVINLMQNLKHFELLKSDSAFSSVFHVFAERSVLHTSGDTFCTSVNF